MEAIFEEDAYPIEQWEVYRLFTDITTPPKEKLVIVAITGAEIRGFFINSNITAFVRQRAHLLPCIAEISCRENPFLRHDSYADCREAYYFTEPSLWGNYVGKLSEPSIAEVKTAVGACKALRGYDKVRILGA